MSKRIDELGQHEESGQDERVSEYELRVEKV
jgi:hypothetical protein